MTDNRTTELTAMERFRTALEKRGIEFETNDDECVEGEERMTVFKANLGESDSDIFVTAKDWYFDGKLTPWLDVEFHSALTPEQAIAATLGSDRLAFLEEKVKLQGDYIDKLTKEKNALFAQGCEAATRHAGQIDAMQQKLEAATLGSGTLTAEQVRKTIMDCSRRGGVTCDGGWYIEGEPQHWQRMADRLNALGSDTKPCYATDYTHEHCKYSVNRGWVENVAHGTLTAEQVRNAVEGHGNIMDNRLYEDWQAVADELNATLGRGTCEVECFDDGVDEGMDGEQFSYAPPTWYLSCGHTAQGTEMPNFCHVCGKAVKR